MRTRSPRPMPQRDPRMRWAGHFSRGFRSPSRPLVRFAHSSAMSSCAKTLRRRSLPMRPTRLVCALSRPTGASCGRRARWSQVAMSTTGDRVPSRALAGLRSFPASLSPRGRRRKRRRRLQHFRRCPAHGARGEPREKPGARCRQGQVGRRARCCRRCRAEAHFDSP